ncbi:putative N6-adenine-specific DNA methylase [Aliiroseovarius halocynthiae]|uniref:Class I SAM-dependent RNA methyltransferase n=1 Tax=Aliiroseovarius halocynthiae TaxID=985055 RepID=A0A545SU92_9RHOB|nr:class I SAM-dependent RNA methyltransferase [Aliiroseovarius halocynthiae]TQV68526.1 class I SAM-dependent RNA methyltransferase [Aliiroseovarius halocynthiae]SMR70927.1 putative N6-adenine-specific DNA methylase [Aliiroseovarius halocynthiae]
MSTDDLEIFFVAPPGLEPHLADEARAAGFATPVVSPGGVTTRGNWSEVWRANLTLRGATRVLVRLGEFRAFHMAQLDKRARKFPWGNVLRADVPIRVEAVCKRSKIYHHKGAAQRVERAISETLGAPISKDAPLVIKVRIDDNLVTISLDSSGESLHKRGHKTATGKAPMRENLAALFLRAAGYDGGEPILDPMCGSGTFLIEAAEMSVGLLPGRSRGFAFEKLASFDAELFGALKLSNTPAFSEDVRFFGSDRNAGAIANSQKNAESAGVAGICQFTEASISDIVRPDTDPGLIIVNPPYGARIGNKKLLFALYGTMGKVFQDRFKGWRVAIITSDGGLAKATGLPFQQPGPPVDHGGTKVKLYQTAPLP